MHSRGNSASLRLWLGMKRGFFRVRPFNLLPYCSQSLLIGDHPRQPLVAVDLGVEFYALLTHIPTSQRAGSMKQRGAMVDSFLGIGNAKSADRRLSAGNDARLGLPPPRPFTIRGVSDERSDGWNPQARIIIGFRAVRMGRAPSSGGLCQIALRSDAVTFPELER
jgi:hypothetical protein